MNLVSQQANKELKKKPKRRLLLMEFHLKRLRNRLIKMRLSLMPCLRKIQNWVFRGGVIESTGGVGVDYLKSNWGSKFSLRCLIIMSRREI